MRANTGISDAMALRAALDAGAARATVAELSAIRFRPEYREACAANACGMYGRCWMCPPDVGPVDKLIDRAQRYHSVLAYQTIHPLADSFDIDGMLAAGKLHNRVAQHIGEAFKMMDFLHLGAGGCRYCVRCAKIDGLPCRFPEKALPSLEAYGVDVLDLAKATGLPYWNGPDTVTYFGIVFHHGQESKAASHFPGECGIPL